MSEWRRHALATFPELRADIERAESVHGVLFAVLPAFEDAYRAIPPNEDLIHRAHAFAAWCDAPERHPEVRGAAMVSFYEHLPDFGPAWRDLPLRVDAVRLDAIRAHLRRFRDPQHVESSLAQLDQVLRNLPARQPSNVR